MRLAHISWQKSKEVFGQTDLVLIAVGSIESHGEHLALGTDTLVPDHLLTLIEQQNPNLLIAPTVPYGACDDLTGYTGSISIGTELLSQVLGKITDALYGYGIRRFAFLNGHGGNIQALDAVGTSLHRRGAWCAVLNWWQMAGELNEAWRGGHGGGEETAAVMAIDTAFVDQARIEDCHLIHDVSETMPTFGFDHIKYKGVSIRFPRDVHHYCKGGWIGPDHPKDATVQWGKEMLAATAAYILDFLQEFSAIPLPNHKGE